MRAKSLVWLGLAAVGVAWAQASVAQTIEERIQILEDKIKEQGETVSHAIGIDMHAMVMTDYNYSFNTPSGDIPLTTWNFPSNTFTLRDGAIFLSRQKDDEAFGFALTVDFGDTARAIQARWASNSGPDGTTVGANLCGNDQGSNCFVEVREAYLTYKTPITVPSSGQPISLKAGKFVTLLGYEVIPTWNNFNPNISASDLFGFSIPFTHTGLLSHLPIVDQVALDLGVVNGWDNVDDNNSGKTLLGGLGITPTDALVIYLSGTYGAENNPIADGGAGNSGAGSKRGVLSGNAAWKVTDMLQLVIDGTWAQETNTNRQPTFTGTNFITANWYGLAGYAIVQPMDKMQLALRGEWFDDPDGTQTGVNNGQTLWEITPTFTYQLTDHLTFRTEYRHDHSNKAYFAQNNGGNGSICTSGGPNCNNGQNLVLTELIAAF